MKPLGGKVALITGVGRRSGIGFALCQRLAQMGADIFYTYWSPYDKEGNLPGAEEDAASFAKMFESMGVRSASAEIDLSQQDGAEELFKTTLSQLGAPDILIHNACVSTRQLFTQIRSEILDSHYAVNMRAPALLCKEFLSHFKETTGGKIIIMTSGQALSVMPDELPYAMTKAGAEMLVLQTSEVFRSRGITINAVDPGPTDTGWITEGLRQEIASGKEKLTIHTPEDIAVQVTTFISGEREAVTGSVLHVGREDMPRP